MTPERDDPILDACLDEVLGRRRPPDLTERILQALAAKHRTPEERIPEVEVPASVRGVLPDFSSLEPSSAQANGQVVTLRDAVARKTRKTQRWQWLVVAATVGGLGIALGIAAMQLLGPNGAPKNQVAVKDGAGPAVNSARAASGQGSQREVAKVRNQNRVPGSDNIASDSDRGPKVIPLDVPRAPGADDGQPGPARPERRYANRQPIPDDELLSFVNAEIQRSWAEARVKPASLANDSEWCRRVYVRLVGRIPTREEVLAFDQDQSPNKKVQLVDKLLGPEYAEQFAGHWANVFTTVLIGRTGGMQDSLASREGLEAYLEQALTANKPYNQIVAELLTATGANRSGAPDFNGAVNFLLAGLNDNATLATSRVSRVFLGQQLQCAQCHGHPSEEKWSQHQYWALNSFLRQVEAKREGDLVRLVDADFVNKPGVTKDGELYYQRPTGELKAAEPEFIDGTKFPASGKLADVERRKELAKLIVSSDEMPRALVNRLWAHFFGYGFTRPIDDMGPHNTPSHPEVLDRLAEQFVAHDYDLKRAIRWIALSDPFSRSSQRAVGALADMPDAGSTPLFSHYYTRQLAAEEVSKSLLTAANLRKKAGGSDDELEKARRGFLGQLHRRMGTDDGEEENLEGGNRQIELMLNSSSSLMQRVISPGQPGPLKTVIDSKEMSMKEKVEHLFLAALSRKPTPQEQDAIGKIVATARDHQPAAREEVWQANALEDIWWALLNSNEFILDH